MSATRSHHEFDVAIVGGGCAGAVAALSAARAGARVALIERMGYLGGTATSVLDSFYGFFTPGEPPFRVVGGIAQEIERSLVAEGHAFYRENAHGGGIGIGYDPEHLKDLFDDITEREGVQVYLHTELTGARTSAGRVERLSLIARGEPLELSAAGFVDASGDASLVRLAGGPVVNAARGGLKQAMTTTMRLANVDNELARSFPREHLAEYVRQARASGRYEVPHDDIHVRRSSTGGGAHALLTRIGGYDATDVLELSAAERAGRRQAREYLRFLQDQVPGYARAELVSYGVHIGVRDSRRAVGDYELTSDDVLNGRKFPDVIAQSGSPVEIQGSDDADWRYLSDERVYDIPLRSLIVSGFDNLLAAGRCLSADHEAQASARLMAQCMAMGEGAGAAAALSVSLGVSPRTLPLPELQDRLVRAGAILFDDQHVPFDITSAPRSPGEVDRGGGATGAENAV
ncbi:FAD-dependent oxidoreductase [Nonomuraea sp. NPDC046570]|uniref:FAD-dependent oxidoreductase n=1 Tax=Nonomuraea sp. NPDC046570 TaxID=3155255 RepID=UPI0033F915B8